MEIKHDTTERFEKVPIDKLIPYARNSRTHSREQIIQLRASLREFGFINAVIVDKNLNIIAGHGRILAAQEEGLDEVPCVFVEHVTEAQKRAYIIADNRLALNAGCLFFDFKNMNMLHYIEQLKGRVALKDNKTKKELQAQYREREIIGGVYIIKNISNNMVLLAATTDLQASKNRFEFSQKTGSCVDMKLQSDWNKQGGEQFVFEVLEELKKSETQTDDEFSADIDILKELWLEKLSDIDFY